MTQLEALKILKENLTNQNLIKHSLAVEAIMKGLAKFFKEDIERWGLVGLLHDIDYKKTKDDPDKHSIVGAEMLKNLGFDEEFVKAVASHNERHGFPLESLMAKALFVSDPLSGLIVAAALVLPSKKLTDLTTENILNRFKEKSFARGANREHIKKCEDLLNIPLEKFIEISLNSMKEIASDLGL
ncbi:MAG: HDIG domain-containing metalloprotein [Minisyncoccia bacterium]